MKTYICRNKQTNKQTNDNKQNVTKQFAETVLTTPWVNCFNYRHFAVAMHAMQPFLCNADVNHVT